MRALLYRIDAAGATDASLQPTSSSRLAPAALEPACSAGNRAPRKGRENFSAGRRARPGPPENSKPWRVSRPLRSRLFIDPLSLANGENIKTASVLMDHASSARALDLYAGFVPNTGLSAGTGHLTFLRRAADPFDGLFDNPLQRKGDVRL